MATQYGPGATDLSFKAAEDLQNYQYHFVKVDTNGEVRLLDSALETPDGVLQNAPDSGQEATVRISGPTKVVANGALNEGEVVTAEYVSTTDAGKAASIIANSGVPLGKVIGATSAEDDLACINLIPAIGQIRNTVVSEITTAGDATFTVAQLLGGLILRDPNGANRSDSTPTTAQLIAAMKAIGVGSFKFTIRNTANATETITLTAGDTGVTISGTPTIAQNNSKEFLVVAASTAAVTIYSLGTVVH